MENTNEEAKRKFKVEGLDHVGIITNGDSGLLNLLKNILGLFSEPQEEVKEQKTVVQKFRGRVSSKALEQTALELLEPTCRESIVQKYRDKNKSGIHHIALRVKGLVETIAFLESKQIKMIDYKPRIGHNGCKIAFIHPVATSGILVELVEK